MQRITPITLKRRALFSSAALLLAAFQFAAGVVFVIYCMASQPQPAREVEWGEGLGALFFVVYLFAGNAVLIVVGLVFAIISFWRREHPDWMREAALAIYGFAAFLVTAVLAWWYFPR